MTYIQVLVAFENVLTEKPAQLGFLLSIKAYNSIFFIV